MLTTFLRYFQPKTGQQQALAALQNIRRGQTENITSSVRRFRTVCTRFVGKFLNDGTIRHYFIQGLDSASTIREILTRRAMTLETAIQAALEIEVIDKENERMIRKAEEPIPAFIPVHHHNSNSPTYQRTKGIAINGMAVQPLAIQEPMLALPAPELDQLRKEMHQISKEMTKSLKELWLNKWHA
jgi:hypothetical protein